MRTDCTATRMVLGCVCLGLLAAGCSSDLKPTNAKLEKGLNAYFENHNECLFPAGLKFPYEVSPGVDAKGEKTHMDAMEKAGLLKQQDDLAMHVERYTLTPMGQRVAPRFCYGHKVVTSVDGFTAPVKQGGFMETTASFHATMMDVPIWVKTDQMAAAFPKMAADVTGAQPGQMMLATAGAGWQVPQ
ncbi:MAG: hypothetical protein WA419_16895 [Silvibacterium sp.]